MIPGKLYQLTDWELPLYKNKHYPHCYCGLLPINEIILLLEADKTYDGTEVKILSSLGNVYWALCNTINLKEL